MELLITTAMRDREDPSEEASLIGADQRSAVALEEEGCQRALLELLLASHPALLSREEIVRELTGDPDEFAERDLVANSLRDLVSAGLLHRIGDFFFATRAALLVRRLQS